VPGLLQRWQCCQRRQRRRPGPESGGGQWTGAPRRPRQGPGSGQGGPPPHRQRGHLHARRWAWATVQRGGRGTTHEANFEGVPEATRATPHAAATRCTTTREHPPSCARKGVGSTITTSPPTHPPTRADALGGKGAGGGVTWGRCGRRGARGGGSRGGHGHDGLALARAAQMRRPCAIQNVLSEHCHDVPSAVQVSGAQHGGHTTAAQGAKGAE
jgi:hypothetical protein